MADVLRVLPRGKAMVPDYDVHHQIRRYHGWKHDPTLGGTEEVIDEKTGKKTGATVKAGAFVRIAAQTQDDVIELPKRREYLEAVAMGDFWPADEETAGAAAPFARGRPPLEFDPEFGNEHPKIAKTTLQAKMAAIQSGEIPAHTLGEARIASGLPGGSLAESGAK